MKSVKIICSGLIGAAVLLAAFGSIYCTGKGKASTSGKKKVVTSFTIIADMAREIAGDAAIVESITRPGAEIHGYDPTPQDIVKAQRADLVSWNGSNLELWFEKFFANVKDVPNAVLTDGIAPIGITEGPYTGKPNPHAWMAPNNAAISTAAGILVSCHVGASTGGCIVLFQALLFSSHSSSPRNTGSLAGTKERRRDECLRISHLNSHLT